MKSAICEPVDLGKSFSFLLSLSFFLYGIRRFNDKKYGYWKIDNFHWRRINLK